MPKTVNATFIAVVPEGTRLCVYGDKVIVVSPAMPPYFISKDGIEPIEYVDAQND